MTEKRRAGHLDDAWLEVDRTEDPSFFVRFLDASRVRALEFARKNPAMAFSHLALEPGLSVLDCGCGTGDMLGIIAGLIAPGEACGGDLSDAMLQEARRRAQAAGIPNLRFERVDVQALPFPDGTFDRVLATQLLVHVPDPRRAIHELCRVTAPEGRVAVADMDWDTLVVGCADKELGRRFTRLFADGIRNPLVVREHAGWLRDEGLTNVQTIPLPIVFDSWEFVRDWLVGPSLPHFVAQGTMSQAEADTLQKELADRSASGRFLASSLFHTVVGQRPRG
jgi:ubiquinone/menaquinone biosynthesis C-methylase UbiE